jgi:hypothetical protein
MHLQSEGRSTASSRAAIEDERTPHAVILYIRKCSHSGEFGY